MYIVIGGLSCFEATLLNALRDAGGLRWASLMARGEGSCGKRAATALG